MRVPLAVFLLVLPAGAWQRDPAIEVYGLTGGYFHGNLSAAHETRAQWGGGVLVPLGRRWGVLADVVTSTVDAWRRRDGSLGREPESSYAHERRVTLMPSIVRLWRRERFSIYAGGGLGQEHERARVRYFFPDGSLGRFETSRTDTTLLLRAGAVVSLGRGVVFRADFAGLPRYMDEAWSKSVSVGLGYRF